MDQVWVVLKSEEIMSIHQSSEGAEAVRRILESVTYDDYKVEERELLS